MKPRKISMIHSLGIYTISNVINSAIPFLLLPLLTQYLSTSDYGILTNFNSLIALLIPVVSMNLMTSLQVVFVKRNEEIGSYISSGMLAMLALTLLFTIFLFLFKKLIASHTGIPESFIIFAGIYAFYQNVVEVLLSVWRMEDRAFSFGVFRISRTILELVIALVLIIIFNRTFDGSIHAMSFSYGIATIITLVILYKNKYLPYSFEWKHVSFLFSYGAPLVPHVLASVFIMYSDKLVITHYEGLSSNGIYSVGFMVGQVIGLLQNSFNQVWSPYVFNHLKAGSLAAKKSIVKWTYLYIVVILLITFLFYLAMPLVFYFLGKSFQQGMTIVLWISLGFAFNGMYKMVSVYFFYYEKTQFIAFISVTTALINILLALWLVPKYSFLGASIGTMVAFFIQFVFTWIWSTRLITMPWHEWKIWKKQ